MQLFGLVNTLLSADQECAKRHLSIQQYSVTPLSPGAGLLGWVQHSDTLHMLIKGYRESRKILVDIEHRLMQQVSSARRLDTQQLTIRWRMKATTRSRSCTRSRSSSTRSTTRRARICTASCGSRVGTRRRGSNDGSRTRAVWESTPWWDISWDWVTDIRRTCFWTRCRARLSTLTSYVVRNAAKGSELMVRATALRLLSSVTSTPRRCPSG